MVPCCVTLHYVPLHSAPHGRKKKRKEEGRGKGCLVGWWRGFWRLANQFLVVAVNSLGSTSRLTALSPVIKGFRSTLVALVKLLRQEARHQVWLCRRQSVLENWFSGFGQQLSRVSCRWLASLAPCRFPHPVPGFIASGFTSFNLPLLYNTRSTR